MKLVVLEGGGSIENKFHKEIFSQFKDIRILIIQLSSNNDTENKEYASKLKSYFKKLGIKKIDFISRNDKDSSVNKKFRRVNSLYLPGGSSENFILNIKKRPVISNNILNFNGLIIANCAGAVLLGKGKIKGNKEIKGLNLFDFYILPHYKINKENLSKIKDIKNKTLCISEDYPIIFILP